MDDRTTRGRLWEIIEKVQHANRDVPREELEEDIALAIREARQRRGKERVAGQTPRPRRRDET